MLFCRVQGWEVSSPCSARTISVNKPLAKRVVTHSRGSTKIPWNTFCCSAGEEVRGMDDADKIVFGQRPAQHESVISGISKVRNRDPGQHKHGMRQWLCVTELLSKLQLLWLSAGGTCC